LVDALWRSIAPDEAEVVRLRMIEQGSTLHVIAAERAPRLSCDRFAQPTLHWRSALTGSFEDFLARRTKKVRWQARKDAARLRETFGDELAVRLFRTSDDLDRLFEDSAEVHRASYQSRLGVGFSTSDVQRALTRLAMDRGWFRGWLLYLRGAPVAFCHGSLYQNTFWLETTAFNPAYAEYRPGAFLLMRLIEDLCVEGTANSFDFGFGDATYKHQLGEESRLEQDFSVWARRPRAIRVHATRTAVLAADRSARSLLRHRQLITKARRLWRGRAAGGGS
jgi:CelD/BcsL family acetyltransferase involved in cellulose biosynthesis